MENLEDFSGKITKEEVAKIEREFHEDLGTHTKASGEKISSGDPAPINPWADKDFISDDVMGLVLGYKNQFLVSTLAKGMGKSAEEMLRDLYVVGPKELSLYKKILQNFIRENFSEYIDKIAKITNADLAALLILETGRWHEAKVLLRADNDNRKVKSE